jgi:predicted AAA+ superfamily ATPase
MEINVIYYTRAIQSIIQSRLFSGKAIILYGARQVGKTTLVRTLMQSYSDDALYLNCDEPDIREKLTEKTSTELHALLGSKKLIVLDEAQRIRNIGLTIKLIVDNYPDVQVIATGSSSLDLSNSLVEPLTGRKIELTLFPLAISELLSQETPLELQRRLERYLIYGQYPGIIHADDPETSIREIAKSYLYRDALEYQTVRNPDMIRKLLQALALQVGAEVSYTELAGLLGIDKVTVSRYISLLERSFIIFTLPPLSRNLRKEIGKMHKVYFYDLGIRNALINNFNSLSLRNDIGALWENFVIIERIKINHNKQKYVNTYFWRTYDHQEIDYLEESGGQFRGFESKWGAEHWRPPVKFLEAYPNSLLTLVNRRNFLENITV